MKTAYETYNSAIKTSLGCITELVRELAIRRNAKEDK